MRSWPFLVGGGLAAYVWSRRGRDPRLVAALPGRWVWPVPRWNGRAPMISDGFDSPRPGVPRHGGVDIMFARLPADAFKAGTPNASKLFVMPDGLVAVAASDGVVRSAMHTPQGFASPGPGVLGHGGVDVMFARLPEDAVKAGEPNASKLLVMPVGLVAGAASDGVVRSAMHTPHGFAVVIDHGRNKVATLYAHLE